VGRVADDARRNAPSLRFTDEGGGGDQAKPDDGQHSQDVGIAPRGIMWRVSMRDNAEIGGVSHGTRNMAGLEKPLLCTGEETELMMKAGVCFLRSFTIAETGNMLPRMHKGDKGKTLPGTRRALLRVQNRRRNNASRNGRQADLQRAMKTSLQNQMSDDGTSHAPTRSRLCSVCYENLLRHILNALNSRAGALIGIGEIQDERVRGSHRQSSLLPHIDDSRKGRRLDSERHLQYQPAPAVQV